MIVSPHWDYLTRSRTSPGTEASGYLLLEKTPARIPSPALQGSRNSSSCTFRGCMHVCLGKGLEVGRNLCLHRPPPMSRPLKARVQSQVPGYPDLHRASTCSMHPSSHPGAAWARQPRAAQTGPRPTARAPGQRNPTPRNPSEAAASNW